MKDGRATFVRRRVLGLLAAAGALAAVPLLTSAMDRAENVRRAGEATRQAADAGRRGGSAWAAEVDALATAAEKASHKRQLAAAVRSRVDGPTLTDLMSSEPWWEPYQSLIATVSYDGHTLTFAQDAAVGAQVLQALAEPVRERQEVVMRVLVARDRALIVAGAPIPGPPGTPALFLARPMDRQVLDNISGRLGVPVSLHGPAGELVASGSPEQLAHLRAAIRGGGLDPGGPDGVPWAAVATPLGPDLSLWTASPPADSDLHQALGGQTVKAAFWSVAGLMALALLWLTWGRSAADPPAFHDRRPASGDRAVPAPSSIPRDRAPAVPATALGAIGRYFLLERIGEGGMAEIFAAASLGAGGFRRFFVIKRLRPEWTSHPDATSHFIDEASLMSTLVHPNIVPVFDFGEADGAYYLAQEYVAGRDLGRLCRRMAEGGQAPLSPQAVLYIVDLVLGALEYAHGRRDDDGSPLQIVHRDVTPANVMISETGEVKLIDFGIVKSARPRLSQTQLGQINGNLEYMAPEQARGQDVDPRTDLFSLGLVAYTAATGERLYRGDSLIDLLNRAASGPGADERERIARLPAPLAALLERALAIDPADRFQNAGEFRAALAPHRGPGKAELIQAMTRNFADDLGQEQDRLVRACPRNVQLSPTKARVA